jgi:hypothetical protein
MMGDWRGEIRRHAKMIFRQRLKAKKFELLSSSFVRGEKT